MAKTILIIIENDVLLGDAMVRRLQDESFQAELISDGAKGFHRIKELKPSLIILDTDLPNMNGRQILEEKFKDGSIANIPTIILTDSDSPSEVNKVLALGAKDYLVKKEFDPELLISKVKQQLNQEGPFPSKKAAATTASAASSASAKSDQPPALTGKKIMWIEDDAFLSEIIGRKLATQGCALVHAGSGEEALPLIEKEHPDILLLDILLPGMDGFEILRQVKSNPAVKNIPVILLSNLGQKSDIEKGEKLGAERFLIKATVSLDEIIAEIKRTIEKFAAK